MLRAVGRDHDGFMTSPQWMTLVDGELRSPSWRSKVSVEADGHWKVSRPTETPTEGMAAYRAQKIASLSARTRVLHTSTAEYERYTPENMSTYGPTAKREISLARGISQGSVHKKQCSTVTFVKTSLLSVTMREPSPSG